MVRVAITHEHADIRRLLTHVEEALPDEVGAQLDLLLSALTSHFALEEGGSGLRAICADAPHLGPRLERILAEHQLLLERVRHLLAMAMDARTTPAELLEEARVLTRAILDHEERETEILSIATNTDYGGAD